MNTNELLKTIIYTLAFACFLTAWVLYQNNKNIEYLNPIVDTPEIEVIEPVEITPTPDPTPDEVLVPVSQKANTGYFEGEASYYSREGCVGCSPNLTMANGEPLDDSRLTLAFNHAPMNTSVEVCNLSTGDCVNATVTDTGGFGRLGRVADLTIATRDAINCPNLCQVSVKIL